MITNFFRKMRLWGKRGGHAIDPDEVFLDATNLPAFDVYQLEGQVERPIGKQVIVLFGLAFLLVIFVFLFRVWNLQVVSGSSYAVLSERNRLDHSVIFAERGVVSDRFGEILAWNEPYEVSPDETDAVHKQTFATRKYSTKQGLAHTLGFLGYPEKDASGKWWRTEYVGKAGIERSLDTLLAGENGLKIVEVDALGKITSESVVRAPTAGQSITVTLDAEVNDMLYTTIKEGATHASFVGGAGVIMDVHTGEIIALTSFPEYDSQVLTDGVATDVIASYAVDNQKPFLNRAVSGTYTPGSVIKPYVAAAALEEGIISPEKQILSTGELRLQNPYYPEVFSIFRDWKAHGLVNVREAIAVSSNVYFFEVGGGFKDQEGLGISRLAAWAHRFGFGEKTGIALSGEEIGVVPTPAWKREAFGDDEEWRVGDTYNTAIGQYGFLVTPIQLVRYIASVANGGTLHTPLLLAANKEENTGISVGVSEEYLQIVREGMRRSVTGGTTASLDIGGISIAGKTGTAQLGVKNEWMNSWATGFWPSDDPQFAFAVVLERAPAGTLRGAAPAMNPFFRWLVATYPEYARGEYPTRKISGTPL